MDVHHRWNFTDEMLRYSYDYSHIIAIFAQENIPHINLTETDWEVAYGIMKFLKTFCDATNIFQKFINQLYIMASVFS